MNLTADKLAYARLKILYGISKYLSNFESIEKSFPQIVSSCAEVFPLKTVILIEHWSGKQKMATWHVAEATPTIIERAQLNARNAYAYLTERGLAQEPVLKKDALVSEHFITLPLIIDNLPAKGILQLEGSHTLDEQDLEFVSTLSDLISVALDRYYKTIKSHQIQVNKVASLESEKVLREGFVSHLTHDLRTPLTVAMLSAESILRKKGDVEVSLLQAEKILKNLKRADKMISDLLDANRIRSGEKLPIHLETFDLNQLTRETIEDLKGLYGDRFRLIGPASIQGSWDKVNIRRILENLMSNAIKYGAAEAPVLIVLEDLNDSVEIKVINQGNPIPSENQKSLFEQFSRGKAAKDSSITGWGIGLALVRGVADAHNGSVSVMSSTETGTIFTVTLPKNSKQL